MRSFADAYQGGQFAGQVLRWVVLLAFGLVLVRRPRDAGAGPRIGGRLPPRGAEEQLAAVVGAPAGA
jgi:hypothetical protein